MPSIGIRTKLAAMAPTIAPRVLVAYTTDASRGTVAGVESAAAIASGNAAPNAIDIGSWIAIAMATCIASTAPNVTSGRLTSDATTSGSRSTAIEAASAAAAAAIITNPSQVIARAGDRGARQAASADPMAKPVITATTIALNAYVVGPSTIASVRVHVT